MQKNNWPKVSIITATLNSARTIDEYFDGINSQIYMGEIEIIIPDGGSSDKTLEIARKNNAKIYFNKLKTAEAAKALGVKKATGDIIALIDSDNITTDKKWLEKMVIPFMEDSEIIASEPILYTYREDDHWLTRYFALIGMGDPINLFIGNYDRYSYVTDKWTGLNLETKSKKGYLKILLKEKIPTIGANGFLIKRKILTKNVLGDYLFDVEVLELLVQKGAVQIAKVDTGVVHLFSGDVWTFIRKQRRRIRDYLYYKSANKRNGSGNLNYVYFGIIKFIFSCIFIIPLIMQSIAGYSRKKDWVWLFHPLACYITLLAYSYETIRSIFVKEEFTRKGWKQ
ncbi:MAG: glycosyltransferase family 2 protein [Patescibacteria group bacterium]